MADLHDEETNPFRDDDQEPELINPSPTNPEPPAANRSQPVTPAVTQQTFRGYPNQAPKTGFCCVRDEYLHSGDDAEIQVRTDEAQ